MARRSGSEPRSSLRRSPAGTPEERESILIAKSLNLIEKQIDEGTASSQVLSMYAKLGSSREKLEQQRLENENAVLRKKLETMEAAIDVRNLMEEALKAFRGYSGDSEEESYDDYELE